MGGSPLRRPWPRAAPGAQSPRVKTNTREAALWGADATDWGAIQPRAAAGHPEGRGCPRPPRRPCKWAGRWPVPKSSAGGGGHRAPLQKSSPVIQAVQGPHGNGGRPARTDERDHSPGVHPVPHPAPGGGRQEGRGGGWLYLGGLGGQGQGSREASAPRAGVETLREGAAGTDQTGRRGAGRLCLRPPAPPRSRPARLAQGELGRRARRSRTGGPGRRAAPASSAAGPGDGSHAAASRPAPRPTCPCVCRPLHLRRWSAPKEPAVGEGGRTGLKPGVTRGTLDATSAWRLTAHSPGRHSDKAPSPRGPPSSPCLRDVRGPEERGPRDDTGHQQPRLPADAARWWPVAPGSEHSLRSGARNGPLGGAVEPGKGSVSGRPGQPRPGQCGAGWGSGRQWP